MSEVFLVKQNLVCEVEKKIKDLEAQVERDKAHKEAQDAIIKFQTELIEAQGKELKHLEEFIDELLKRLGR